MKKFSKKEALKFGWTTTRKHFFFLAEIVLFLMLLNVLPGIITPAVRQDFSLAVSLLVSIFFGALQMILNIGLITISIRYVEGKTNTFKDLFTHIPFTPYLLGSIVYGCIVAGGIILLIIPGIIWGIKYGFYSYLIVDKDVGVMDSIKRSAQLTQGIKWDLFLFGLLLGLINVAGFLLFFVGLFVTLPVTMLAMAYVYRKLLEISS